MQRKLPVRFGGGWAETYGAKAPQRAALPPYATDLVNADAAVTSIQKLLGHRWLESTQTYILANDKQVCEDYYAACAKLEGWQYLRGAA